MSKDGTNNKLKGTDMKFEVGKFYTWGNGGVVYKIDTTGLWWVLNPRHKNEWELYDGGFKELHASLHDLIETHDPGLWKEGKYYRHCSIIYTCVNGKLFFWSLDRKKWTESCCSPCNLIGKPIEVADPASEDSDCCSIDNPCSSHEKNWEREEIEHYLKAKPDFIKACEDGLIEVQEQKKQYQEEKTMNFKEAIIALNEGKCVMNYGGSIYKFFDGNYFVWDSCMREWWRAYFLADAMMSEWRLCDDPSEPPKPQKSEILSEVHLSMVGRPSAWSIAINTFLLLKSHPLAKKPNSEEQWALGMWTPDEDEVDFEVRLYCLHSLSSKYSHISPCFNTSEDARKAIQDVGEKSLLHMFRTFSGLN